MRIRMEHNDKHPLMQSLKSFIFRYEPRGLLCHRYLHNACDSTVSVWKSNQIFNGLIQCSAKFKHWKVELVVITHHVYHYFLTNI